MKESYITFTHLLFMYIYADISALDNEIREQQK
jgi:hypothetical protein